MANPSLLRWHTQASDLEAFAPPPDPVGREVDDIIWILRSSLVQLTPVVAHLNAEISTSTYADPHLFPTFIQPCQRVFQGILRLAKFTSATPSLRTETKEDRFSECFSSVVRASLRFFNSRQATWEAFAFFSPLLIVHLECQLHEIPSIAMSDFKAVLRKYSQTVNTFLASVGSDLLNEWRSRANAVRAEAAEWPVIVQILDGVPKLLHDTRGLLAELVQLRSKLIGSMSGRNSLAFTNLLQMCTKLETMIATKDLTSELVTVLNELSDIVDRETISLVKVEVKWDVTSKMLRQFQINEPSFEMDMLVSDELEKIFPDESWAHLPPTNFKNCLIIVLNYLECSPNAGLSRSLLSNLLSSKNSHLESLSEKLVSEAEKPSLIKQLEDLIRRLHGVLAASSVSDTSQSFIRILIHLFNLMVHFEDQIKKVIPLLPPLKKIYEILEVSAAFRKFDSIAQTVLAWKTKMKNSLKLDDGLQQLEIDGLQSVFDVSKDVMSVLIMRANMTYALLELLEKYSHFLGSVNWTESAVPLTKFDLASRELDASMTLLAIVKCGHFFFAFPDDFGADWLQFVIQIMNPSSEALRLIDLVPFCDFSQCLLAAWRALEYLQMEISDDPDLRKSEIQRYETLRSALVNALSSGSFPTGQILTMVHRLFELKTHNQTKVSSLLAPLLVFLRSFEVFRSFTFSVSVESATSNLSCVVFKNFLLAIRQLLIESDKYVGIRRRISNVVSPEEPLFAPLDPQIGQISSLLRDLSELMSRNPIDYRSEILQFLSAPLARSDFPMKQVYFEIEALASSITKTLPTSDKFRALVKILEISERTPAEFKSFLELSIKRCLLESLITHTQYMFWVLSPKGLSYPPIAPLETESNPMTTGTFSVLTSQLPGLVSGVRLLRAGAEHLGREFKDKALLVKGAELAGRVTSWLGKFSISELERTRLNSEYQKLTNTLNELQSAQQKYSEVAESIQLGEAWFLSNEVGAKLSKQIMDDQLVQLAVEQTEHEIAELTHELEICDHRRLTLRNRRDGGQRVTRLRELAAVFAERSAPPAARQSELEQELVDLMSENEQLLGRKLELEGKRPPSAEDELRLFTLHVAASRGVAERTGERRNEVLKKQIAENEEAIHRLQKRLTVPDSFGMAFDKRRMKLMCDGVDPRTATKMMTLTIERLEGLVAQRRQCTAAGRKET
jgi:hypothetical protein